MQKRYIKSTTQSHNSDGNFFFPEIYCFKKYRTFLYLSVFIIFLVKRTRICLNSSPDAKCWSVTFVRDMSLAFEDKVSNE